MLIDQRLPKHSISLNDRKIDSFANSAVDIIWQNIDRSQGSISQQQSFIHKRIGEFVVWLMIEHEFDYLANGPNFFLGSCGEHTCDDFLGSKAYQEWKTRKTRAPSLLYASGKGT